MLTDRQKKIAQAVFEGVKQDEAFLQTHKLTGKQRQALLENPEFVAEIVRQCEKAREDFRVAAHRYGLAGINKLGEMLDTAGGETARRAASDLIKRFLEVAAAREKPAVCATVSTESARAIYERMSKWMDEQDRQLPAGADKTTPEAERPGKGGNHDADNRTGGRDQAGGNGAEATANAEGGSRLHLLVSGMDGSRQEDLSGA